MKFLNPQSRYQPRYEATLDEVFESIDFTPYSSRCPERRRGWLFLSDIGMDRSCGYAGGGWHHVKFKPALIEMLAPSIYSNSAELLHEELHAELRKRNDGSVVLTLQFSQIIGSYQLMEVEEAEAIAWLDRHKEAA